MLINKNWLGRTFREEASSEGGEGGGETITETTTEATSDTTETTTDAPTVEQPEWLQSKYITEGKSQEESISEQAKAYNELSGKFGSFTGAPESYEVSFSDELKEAGIELNDDDPMIESAKEFANKAGMNQDGFNGMLELYGMQKIADAKALQEDNDKFSDDQMKILGPNAKSRIDNITQWANKNLEAEDIQGLESMTSTAESVKAIERLISMTRGASVDIDSSTSNSGASTEDVNKMQFEMDSHGNRRINTDPDFRKSYQKLRNEVYGQEDHKVIVNG